MDIKVILIDSKLIYCLCAHVHWLEGSFLELVLSWFDLGIQGPKLKLLSPCAGAYTHWATSLAPPFFLLLLACRRESKPAGFGVAFGGNVYGT